MVPWMRKGQGSDKHDRSGISAGHSLLASECLEGLHTKNVLRNICGHLASSNEKLSPDLASSLVEFRSELWFPPTASNAPRISGKPCKWILGGLFIVLCKITWGQGKMQNNFFRKSNSVTGQLSGNAPSIQPGFCFLPEKAGISSPYCLVTWGGTYTKGSFSALLRDSMTWQQPPQCSSARSFLNVWFERSNTWN